ncbi:transcriptional regulator, AraC family with amidase-like domain [Dyella jiangningensis]|uniref:GlxA family transcriptional regulator n=1 Tax=Dyella sp. AtDHG13 TaxID=1938897 RepID=UPI000883C0FE|nr:helix-turn-helix domain-containing protein [Dyella sp. AtDHG13]PXV61767.1 AraC family transcriptional regulator with amidase-like domain [Dyella sp. AtDHG13]SDJ64566.1 transcriptional regulator, AraC family with amidase-like domain [Dyella jiangningensis]
MHTVAVVAFDGISPFHLSVPCIVFGDDLLKLGTPRYRLFVCGERRGRVATMSGFDIEVKHGLATLRKADTIIVPAWRTPGERPPEALLRALRQAHARGSRIVGLCLGTFVLAEAGLLEGRTASTHWAWAEEFERAYPGVTLDRHAIYVDEGDLLTSAGTAAALDCCLHLLRKDLGADIANRVARRLVVAPQRHGDQAQYIENPVHEDHAPDALSKTLDWAIAHLKQPLCVEKLAAHAGMSVRTFSRHFRKKTGSTVIPWLLHHRLAAAQRLLETSRRSIDQIAESVGFGSTVSFRQHFTRAFSISPASYRRQFRAQPVSC